MKNNEQAMITSISGKASVPRRFIVQASACRRCPAPLKSPSSTRGQLPSRSPRERAGVRGNRGLELPSSTLFGSVDLRIDLAIFILNDDETSAGSPQTQGSR